MRRWTMPVAGLAVAALALTGCSLDTAGPAEANFRVQFLNLADHDEVEAEVTRRLADEPELQALQQQFPELMEELKALLTLAHASEYLLNPIFGQTDAVGTVMNEKIEPVTLPLRRLIALLRGQNPDTVSGKKRRGRRRQA